MTSRTIFILTLAAILWGFVFGLQRPPPRYSQQYMPQTSFTCRNKIVGSYYADPETDCQLFHVCVSVAGSIQDYRFLCPNDTAFDQESQTCADWYDVDCEAATLYYASDNFDLYRIGSGLESLHYDNIRSDYEPQDHLQRSESNDPIRSPLNSYNTNNYKDSESSKKSTINNNNNYSARNQNSANSEVKKEANLQENQEFERKTNARKVNRKLSNNGFANVHTSKSTTIAPLPTQHQFRHNDNKSAAQQNLAYTTPTSSRSSVHNTQKSNQPIASTLRPTIRYSATLAVTKPTANSQDTYFNYQTTLASTTFQNNFNSFNRFETTAKPANAVGAHYPEQRSFSVQHSQATTPTTKQTSVDYQQHNQANYDKRVYNNNYDNSILHKTNSTAYASSTSVTNHYNNNNKNNNYNNYDNNNNNNNKNNHRNVENHQLSLKSDDSNIYATNAYTPTTYSPITKKYFDNRQYYDKLTTLTTKLAHYTETDSTKVSKKVTHYKGHQNYETSTKSYEFNRSSVGLGFSPSSVNHLAENIRSTTPTSRRAASPTTYNPNNFHVTSQTPKSKVTQGKSTYYTNPSVKQYSTTAKYVEETATRVKITKKNDYDYAYYDNGPLEYDSIELEHVGSNKESVKIT